MYKLEQIANYINEIAPWDTAMEKDNVGLLVNSGREVSRALVALDITNEVVEEAAQKGCQLIVSHHPVIYRPFKDISTKDPVFALCQNNISAICAHTNWDAAALGVNTVLAEMFGVYSTQRIEYAAYGELSQNYTPEEFALLCVEKLDNAVRLVNANRPIKKVMFAGGSCPAFLEKAQKMGVDCAVVGDAGHHDGLDALRFGISLVAAGHFTTENPAMPKLMALLQSEFEYVDFIFSEAGRCPFENYQ